MIDIGQVIYEMYPKLSDYCGVEQILRLVQDLDQKFDLVYPRIIINPSLPYEQGANFDIVKYEKVAHDPDAFDDETQSFESDVLISRYRNPRVTLSINGYGNAENPVRNKVLQAQEWFRIKELGKRFFNEYANIVVFNVGNVENRTQFLEVNYEQRWGFDVILQFDEKVQIREKNIERVDVTNTETGESQNIDL